MAYAAPAVNPGQQFNEPILEPGRPPMIGGDTVNVPRFNQTGRNMYMSALKNMLDQVRGNYRTGTQGVDSDYHDLIASLGGTFDDVLGMAGNLNTRFDPYTSALLENMTSKFTQDLDNPEYADVIGLLQDTGSGDLLRQQQGIMDQFAGRDMGANSGIMSAQLAEAARAQGETSANARRQALMGVRESARENALKLEGLKSENYNTANKDSLAALTAFANFLAGAYGSHANAMSNIYGANAGAQADFYKTATGAETTGLGTTGEFLTANTAAEQQANQLASQIEAQNIDRRNAANMTNYQRQEEYNRAKARAEEAKRVKSMQISQRPQGYAMNQSSWGTGGPTVSRYNPYAAGRTTAAMGGRGLG